MPLLIEKDGKLLSFETTCFFSVMGAVGSHEVAQRKPLQTLNHFTFLRNDIEMIDSMIEF